jgi:diacylglycerol kinase family enzyme
LTTTLNVVKGLGPKKIQTTESKLNDLILILNPNSQGGATGKNWNETYDKIRTFLPNRHRIIFTKKANDGTLIARKFLRAGYKNIVAVGGDGTLNEIANGFFHMKSKINLRCTIQGSNFSRS